MVSILQVLGLVGLLLDHPVREADSQLFETLPECIQLQADIVLEGGVVDVQSPVLDQDHGIGDLFEGTADALFSLLLGAVGVVELEALKMFNLADRVLFDQFVNEGVSTVQESILVV